MPEPERQVGQRLYQLDVLLLHDTRTTPIKAGTVLVAAPYIPDKRFFWAGVPPEFRPSYEGSVPGQTMESNETTFRRMLKLSGERAPDHSRRPSHG